VLVGSLPSYSYAPSEPDVSSRTVSSKDFRVRRWLEADALGVGTVTGGTVVLRGAGLVLDLGPALLGTLTFVVCGDMVASDGTVVAA
jgi:hypothetical protein